MSKRGREWVNLEYARRYLGVRRLPAGLPGIIRSLMKHGDERDLPAVLDQYRRLGEAEDLNSRWRQIGADGFRDGHLRS